VGVAFNLMLDSFGLEVFGDALDGAEKPASALSWFSSVAKSQVAYDKVSCSGGIAILYRAYIANIEQPDPEPPINGHSNLYTTVADGACGETRSHG
jgi:hypothetical protein